MGCIGSMCNKKPADTIRRCICVQAGWHIFNVCADEKHPWFQRRQLCSMFTKASREARRSFFLRTKWVKGVWGQSGPNGPEITELGAVEPGVAIGWRWGIDSLLVRPWGCILGSGRETGIEWGQRQRHFLERWEVNGYFSLLRKPAVRLGDFFFLRAKWVKGVWGQSGQKWGACTRWQLGAVGYRFPSGPSLELHFGRR